MIENSGHLSNSSLLSFHHVGVASDDLKADVKRWIALGFVQVGPVYIDSIQDVRLCFLELGDFRVEIIQDINTSGPTEGFLKRGTKIYHIGYVTDAFDDTLELVKKAGYRKISPISEAVAFNDKRVVFCIDVLQNLIEIIEL